MVSVPVLSQSAGARRSQFVASLLSGMVSVGIALLVFISSAYAAEVPRGVFSLTPPNKPVNSAILTNPSVVGVSIRAQWQTVEQTEGLYNWSYFDNQITRAMNAGKTVLLRIPAGGQNTPQWVFDAGIQTFSFMDTIRYHDTYGQTLTIPVFWDPVFLAKKKSFIAAMGRHFATNSHIVLVSVACANSITDDWNVPSSKTDVKNWLAIGYTSDKLINACNELIDASMEAMPNKTIFLSINASSNHLDPAPDYVPRNVVERAMKMYPGRFIVQKNSLSADTPDPALISALGNWQIIFDNQPEVAGQMLWYVTNDSTCRMNSGVKPCDPAAVLQEAVRTGGEYGMSYLEIYQPDILNPALVGVISYAADVLAP